MESRLDFMELAAILQCLRNESRRSGRAGLDIIMAKVMDMMRDAEIKQGDIQ